MCFLSDEGRKKAVSTLQLIAVGREVGFSGMLATFRSG